MPVEAAVDAAVVSWHQGYRAEVAAIRESLRRDPVAELDAAVQALIAADPRRRDQLSTAPWRSTLRVVGFLAAATLIAGILMSIGFGRRNQPPIDVTTAALVVAIASVVALACLGSSLLFPSRMGTPNRMVSMSLWIAVVGALGSVGGLPLRSDGWDAATPVWWVVSIVCGVALLVLAAIVSLARLRSNGSSRAFDEHSIMELRLSLLAAALDRSIVAVESAWQRLDERVRDDLERERAEALEALTARGGAVLDVAWLRSTTPGVLGLPYLADQVHRGMHLGHAQIVERRAPGPFGYFVMRRRGERAAQRDAAD